MNKTIKIIISSVIISLVIGIFNVETVFNDCSTMIQILLGLLGLCLTSYTFVLIPIKNIVKGDKEKKGLVSNLLKEYKDNMLLVFVTCILLIFVDLICSIDFPLISNPTNIDFGLFKINSFKMFFKLVLEDFLCILSLYSFYDIMQSIFILVNSSIINKD